MVQINFTLQIYTCRPTELKAASANPKQGQGLFTGFYPERLKAVWGIQYLVIMYRTHE